VGDDHAQRARDRAISAGTRADELRERIERLHAGEVVNADDFAASDRAAKRAVAHAKQAHRSAADAHKNAADAHRAAAVAFDAAGKHEKAELHRRDADEDDALLRSI
jgi:hypothetical protein